MRATDLVHRLLSVALHVVHAKKLIGPQHTLTVQPVLLRYPIQVRQVFAAGHVVRHCIPSLSAVFSQIVVNHNVCSVCFTIPIFCFALSALGIPDCKIPMTQERCVDTVGADISTAGRQPCGQGSRCKKEGSRTFSASKLARRPGSLGRSDALRQHSIAIS